MCSSPVGIEQAFDVPPGLGVGRRRQAARGDGPAAHAQHQPQPRSVPDGMLAEARRVFQLLEIVQQVLLGHRDTCNIMPLYVSRIFFGLCEEIMAKN